MKVFWYNQIYCSKSINFLLIPFLSYEKQFQISAALVRGLTKKFTDENKIREWKMSWEEIAC